jgi:hypothetical protein
LRLYENALTSHLAASLTPHAPYSVSDELFSSIAAHNNTEGTLWSLHNQESSGENELFESHEGKLVELMQKAGVDFFDDIPFQQNPFDVLPGFSLKKEISYWCITLLSGKKICSFYSHKI